MTDYRSKAFDRAAELVSGSRITMALSAAVEADLPDLLAEGPKSAEELAARSGLAVDAVRRLLRNLLRFGVFEETADGTFKNTAVADFLRADAVASLRPLLQFIADGTTTAAWQQLGNVVRTGEPSFEAVHGISLFEHVNRDQKLREIFVNMMISTHGPETPKIANGFPFGRFARILDVGGGNGHILAEILKSHGDISGAVFELASTAGVARNFLSEMGLEDRTEVIDGDFFAAVPEGFDAYMMKSILHDWNDEKATQILRNCREAMPGDGRVLVIELVVEPCQPLDHPHPMIDMELMVLLGGKERTAKEYAALFEAAGLALERVVPIQDSFFSVVEAKSI